MDQKADCCCKSRRRRRNRGKTTSSPKSPIMSPDGFAGIASTSCPVSTPTRTATSSSRRRGEPKGQRHAYRPDHQDDRGHLGIHMSPHQFRHLAGSSYLDDNPEDIETARALLGHAWSKTTQIYVGSSSRRASRAYSRLPLRAARGSEAQAQAATARASATRARIRTMRKLKHLPVDAVAGGGHDGIRPGLRARRHLR